MSERLPMAWNYADEACEIAITATLKPLADSPTMRRVKISYWRDDVLLDTCTFASQALFNWRRAAPSDTTHISIDA